MFKHLEEILDIEEVLAETFKNKLLKPQRKPNVEQTAKVLSSVVKALSIKKLNDIIYPLFEDVIYKYVETNGEYDSAVNLQRRDDYESGMDDALEASLEPLMPFLSADWLGKSMIDTRVWMAAEADKLAQSAAKEVYKQISYGKSPAKVLSSAGFTNAHIEVALEQHLNDTQETETMADMKTLLGVAAAIALTIGANYDIMHVSEQIDLAQNADAAIANAAGARLGLDPEGVYTLQMGFMEHGGELNNVLVTMVDTAIADGAKAKPKKRAKRTKKGAPPEEGSLDTRVLALIKKHTSCGG